MSNRENEKPKFTARVSNYFKGVRAELKKVIWPTPKQIVNNTIAVITVVLVTAAIVLLLDLAFEGLNTFGINKLKTIVSNQTTNNTVENNAPLENVSNEEANNTDVENASDGNIVTE